MFWALGWFTLALTGFALVGLESFTVDGDEVYFDVSGSGGSEVYSARKCYPYPYPYPFSLPLPLPLALTLTLTLTPNQIYSAQWFVQLGFTLVFPLFLENAG